MSKTYLIVNPSSGRLRWSYLVERAVSRLEQAGWQVEALRPRDGQDVTRFARRAAQEGLKAIFVAGGDGTLRRAVAGLIGSETALGVLPRGTANVWAQEMGLFDHSLGNILALERSAAALANAAVYSMDVGICNGEPFLLWAGVGLDAMVVHEMEMQRSENRYLTEARYAANVLLQASTWGGVNIEVEADGVLHTGHVLLVVISNIRNYAGGLAEISPQARLDDGEMDIWLFSGDNMLQSVQHAWNLLLGQHTQSKDVHKLSFRRLHLRSEAQIYLQLDGDPIDVVGDLQVQVRPRALRVLVPAAARAALFDHPAEHRSLV